MTAGRDKRYPAMHTSSIVLPCDREIPGHYEASPPLVQDHDRVARGMNGIVVHRLFSAGLALETALDLIGDHPGAAKVREAIADLDRAILDLRNSVFGHHQLDSSSGGPVA